MLGFLKNNNQEVNGCLPGLDGCDNPIDPKDENSDRVVVDDTAVYQQADPSHSISGTTSQIYGTSNTSADMNGFISSYISRTGDDDLGPTIMKCFSEEHVPAISALAQEFAMFDGWFASVPGPTQVNRAYSVSATSNGMGTNDVEKMIKGFPQKTMFKQLEEMGLDYKVYFELIPGVLMFKDMRRQPALSSYHLMRDFYDDLEKGDMPAFSWVEPRYYDTPRYPASDQHPDHDVSVGDQLIKDMYEAIRNSPLWNKTAFIITYDEHGGFFDHVPPPENVPSPDGIDATDDPFDFTRLGVRIPTVVVSPWTSKGTVVHAPPAGEGQYDHTSVMATLLHKMLEPAQGYQPPSYLTERDAWAATFEDLFTMETSPRTDCPEELPEVPSHRVLFPDTLPPLNGLQVVSELQREFLAVAAGASEDSSFDYKATESWTVLRAVDYITGRMKKIFGDVY